jgi:Amt family ammonium transporter
MAWRISDPMGLFAQWGTLDFAGGTVVHINAGIAGLVACLFVGKRKGFRQQILAPHNVPLTVVGAAMLWVGWFGFNAGSQLAADGVAGMAMLVTQLATAAAVVTWMIVEWIKTGKPTAVGVATGAVAGLVAITPASGTCGPMGAIAIGVAAGLGCYLGATVLKNALGYDDSLDVFGVHGIGGIIGALLTGVFASQTLGGNQDIEIGAQVFKQLKSVIVTIVWSGVVSAVVLGILKVTIGLRASEQAEIEGLDSADHGESGYSLH